MNFRVILHLISYLLIVFGIAMSLCWVVSRLSGDPAVAQSGMLASSILIMSVGVGVGYLTRGHKALSRIDGFGIVTFGWLAAALAGALPFLLTGTILNPVAATFESMSGFTTTGASVLTDLEEMPRGIMLWRCWTQWFGGMGVLVLCVAILPFLGVGGMQIFRAEMPGPTKDRLTPRIAGTAKLFWGIYTGFSIVLFLLLWASRMDWFDALCHMFTTMPTGGFSPRTGSIGAYDSVYIERVIIVFMLIAGTNFTLHYVALTGAPLKYILDPEFRVYLIIWVMGVGIITLNLISAAEIDSGDALRGALFQVSSILTTTGYCTENFDLWPNTSRILLLLLMFSGGCAGSTSGGIKVVRIFLMFKKSIREIRRFLKPQAVVVLKLGRSSVPQDSISHISGFFVMFIFLFAFFSFVMSFWSADFVTAISSVAATMGNIGPGLGEVGAAETYASIQMPGKITLIICMLLGRLELYTVLIALIPVFWKR